MAGFVNAALRFLPRLEILRPVSKQAGIVVSPEWRASEAGAAILRDGGTAIEAAIATAAALSVLYPHMTGIGGDAFWLVDRPGESPIAIMGCGAAGDAFNVDVYAGLQTIPTRGPLAANTVAGAISSWQAALNLPGAKRLSLARILRDATAFAANGAAKAPSLTRTIEEQRNELSSQPGWSETFDVAGDLRLPRLAGTFRKLAIEGLGSFYRGGLADDIAGDLADIGAPITDFDLNLHLPTVGPPLHVRIRDAALFNTPPPTQGLASLLILALADRLPPAEPGSAEHIHALVEATKAAFAIRNAHVHDPGRMTIDPQALLHDTARLDHMAAAIDLNRASLWPRSLGPGDTTWFGAADSDGCVVSVIQSIYFEFGSGIVLPRTGIVWQNRGSSFRLARDGWNALRPGARPFHTLNPALAKFDDGRTLAYGAMGGEGQPQTQAAVFTAYARHGLSLDESMSAPRWLLGRTWGDDTTALRLESRFDQKTIDALRNAGHPVQMVDDYSDLMGHAGAILREPDGRLDGASDPRCDGAAAWA